MRHSIIQLWSLPVILLTLASCTQTPSGNNAAAPTNDTTKKPAPKAQHIIRKHINIPYDFSYITNLGSVDIIYTQGNYSIEAEGDSTTLSYLSATFDSNLLTVSVLTDNNVDLNLYGNSSNLKLYVSCPELKCVSICGNGNFESQATWRTEDLQLGTLGTGSMKLGRVECTTFSLQSTNTGDFSVSHLQAEDATIYSNSSAHIDLNVDVNNLILINDGTQTTKLTGKANKTVIKKPDDKNLTNQLL